MNVGSALLLLWLFENAMYGIGLLLLQIGNVLWLAVFVPVIVLTKILSLLMTKTERKWN